MSEDSFGAQVAETARDEKPKLIKREAVACREILALLRAARRAFWRQPDLTKSV
jgi:hypothetical protein